MSSRDEEYRLWSKRVQRSLHAWECLRFYTPVESTWAMVRAVNKCGSMLPQQFFQKPSLHQRHATGIGWVNPQNEDDRYLICFHSVLWQWSKLHWFEWQDSWLPIKIAFIYLRSYRWSVNPLKCWLWGCASAPHPLPSPGTGCIDFTRNLRRSVILSSILQRNWALVKKKNAFNSDDVS